MISIITIIPKTYDRTRGILFVAKELEFELESPKIVGIHDAPELPVILSFVNKDGNQLADPVLDPVFVPGFVEFLKKSFSFVNDSSILLFHRIDKIKNPTHR